MKFFMVLICIILTACNEGLVKPSSIPINLNTIEIKSYDVINTSGTYKIELSYNIDKYDVEKNWYVCGVKQLFNGAPIFGTQFSRCQIKEATGETHIIWKPKKKHEELAIVWVKSAEDKSAKSPEKKIIDVLPPYELVVELFQSSNSEKCNITEARPFGRCPYRQLAESNIGLIGS
ncbi:hypothetical protein [Microbulbifer spongiae]|uniref:Lipoprotein n=1 Tax=Microbulbifer spongiae TaxID=2944933 RepID=A0ABY9E5C8_9GAMM|nr:hypothetical protein [Microbulbifer sp. MI-G]WKD48225.1 hypothetical protein M8T91_09760 [Microbulbifer sp. MI-G]